jgi:hypothetical protein
MGKEIFVFEGAMQQRFWKALCLAALLLAPSCRAQNAPTPQNSRLGINLNGPQDWNSELPFNDVFRMARPWISQKQGEGWGKGPQLELDEHGWVKKLEANCYADSPILTVQKAPLGEYVVLYEGEGKLDFWPGGNVSIKESKPGRIVLDVKKPGLFVKLVQTNPDNYIKNIRVLLPDTEKTYKEQPFRAGFLQTWKAMNTYRFMDWMHTNGSKIEKWSQRPQPTDATFSGDGVALETMIDLCNRQGANAWFCMPHKADDDFVRQFATMVKERLDPKLHVYIEYSNEVWNGQFEQNRYAAEKGKAAGIDPAERPWEVAGKYYARSSMEIFKIWEQVFGGREKLVRVLAWQAANPWWSDNIILPFEDAYKNADALAIAPYITVLPRPGGKPNSDEMATWTTEQILDYTEKTALPESLKWMRDQKKIADKYKVRLICYEAGQHLVGVGGGENNQKLTDLFIAANRHPRMGEIYKKYLDGWLQEGGGDLMALFSSVGESSKWGSWGIAESYDQTPADAPKLSAVLEWNKTNPRGAK